MGTSLGLLEFNEQEHFFKHIPFDEKLYDYRVTGICSINDSSYFLNSHSKKGVFVYHRNKSVVKHAYSSNDSLMKNQKVRLVLKGPDETFFFHIDYDLYRYDRTKDLFSLIPNKMGEKSYLHYGLTDHNNTFWILSGQGVYCLSPEDEITRVKDIDHYCPLNKQIGTSIIYATDSTLYIGINWWGVVEVSLKTKKVVSVLRKTKTQLNELSNNEIFSLQTTSNGALWWCSNGAYLLSENLGNEKFLLSGSTEETQSYAVLDITEDKDGIIWVGTDGGGIHTYSISENKTVPAWQMKERNLPKSKVIMSIFEDSVNNEIWFGTYGEGIFNYKKRSNQLTEYVYTENESNTVGSNRIWDIIMDANENILISSLCRSVDIFNKNNKEWKHLSSENKTIRDNCVTTFEKDKQGNIWFGYTEAGIDVYNHENGMTNTIPRSKDRVLSLYHDNDNVWMGCMNGIKVYSKRKKDFIEHPVCKLLENVRVNDIYKDSNKRIWIASENGLYYFNTKDSIPTLSSLDKYFKNNVAKCIYETTNNHLLIGGIAGLLSIDVENAGNKQNADFAVHLTDFCLFGNSLSLSEFSNNISSVNDLQEIVLPYNKNYLNVSFSTMDIENIPEYTYAFRVDNYYPQWQAVEQGKNKLELPNLQPGKYKVEIRASLLGNANVYKVRTFNIIITPPFWKAWWFRILIICTVGLMIVYRIKQIKNKNKILEELVAERTKELRIANSKLETEYETIKENSIVIEMKNEELSETLETKNKLLAVIGHDFKNPLNALTGFSSLLNENINSYPKEKIKKFVQQIHTLANTLSAQMISILDWSRGQMDSVSYNPVDINIESIIKDVIQLSKYSAHQKEISINIKSEFKYNAFVDVRMISTVFRNVLSNAIKFSHPQSEILIAIQENTNEIEISFSDLGIGMDEKKVNNIFNSFNPDFINYGTKNEIGTGLGLQICKAFVEKNKGTINVESKLDKGTTFTIILPKATSLAFKSNSTKNINDDSFSEIEDFQNTMLIIEDNPDILGMLIENFRLKYELHTASNGEEGLQQAITILPDIIISDINMPGMNGVELCNTIRKKSLTKHIPLILITAENDENLEMESYELGATDFIKKPFDIDLLKKKANAILLGRKNFREKVEFELSLGNSKLPLSAEDEIINKILSLINENYTDSFFEVNKIAEKVGLSRSQLWRKVKGSTGKTPSELLKDVRLNKAAEMLKQGDYRISEISYHVGFSDQRYFARVFQKEFGITPTDFMKQNESKDY